MHSAVLPPHPLQLVTCAQARLACPPTHDKLLPLEPISCLPDKSTDALARPSGARKPCSQEKVFSLFSLSSQVLVSADISNYKQLTIIQTGQNTRQAYREHSNTTTSFRDSAFSYFCFHKNQLQTAYMGAQCSVAQNLEPHSREEDGKRASTEGQRPSQRPSTEAAAGQWDPFGTLGGMLGMGTMCPGEAPAAHFCPVAHPHGPTLTKTGLASRLPALRSVVRVSAQSLHEVAPLIWAPALLLPFPLPCMHAAHHLMQPENPTIPEDKPLDISGEEEIIEDGQPKKKWVRGAVPKVRLG